MVKTLGQGFMTSQLPCFVGELSKKKQTLTTVIHIHLALAAKPPQLIKAPFTLYNYYDIFFSCILPVNKGMFLQQSLFSFMSIKDVLP